MHADHSGRKEAREEGETARTLLSKSRQESAYAGGEPILEVRDLVKHYPLTQGILIKKQVGAVKAEIFRPLGRAGAPDAAPVIALGPTEIAQFLGDEARPETGRLSIAVLGTDTIPTGEGFVIAGPAPETAG